ncbi:MAG: hypothetical protein K0S96_789, partial [Geminicoccaceae bacterium]|nr:hypothetical protein [Geminicoccaceae bacterium]
MGVLIPFDKREMALSIRLYRYQGAPDFRRPAYVVRPGAVAGIRRIALATSAEPAQAVA